MSAQLLREREEAGTRSFIRLALPPKLEPRLALGEVTLDDLLAAVRQALAVRPADPDVGEVVSPITITIGQKIAFIQREMARHAHISFQNLLRQASSRMEIIVTFLAVLELIKQRRIEARQEALFGDIFISALTPVSSNPNIPQA
jgi:segregation and condensation protein A